MRYVSDSSGSGKLRRIMRSWWFWLLAILVVASIVVGGVYLWWSGQPLISKHEVKDVAFPVYVPKKSATDYKVNNSKVRVGDRSVAYDVISKIDNSQITITVQPVPTNFDMSKMSGSGTVSSVATDNGTLYNLSAAGRNQYLLNTGDALVFFTSQNKISTATINSLATSLVKQN